MTDQQPTNNAIVRDLALASATKHVDSTTADGTKARLHLAHKDLQKVSVERLTDAEHIEANPNFTTVESFCKYLKHFSGENNASLYVCGQQKEAGKIFTATLDYHTPDTPGRELHTASLSVEHSAQWLAWTHRERDRMSQRAFLHFIEDNVEDIIAPDSATLMQQIKTTKVDKSANTSTTVAEDERKTRSLRVSRNRRKTYRQSLVGKSS